MRGETILCISTRCWDSLWRSTQQIMWRLAADNRVLFFEPGRDPDQPVLPELLRNAPHFLAPHVTEITPNLSVIGSPSTLPYAHQQLPSRVLRVTVPLVARVNAAVLIQHVRRVSRSLGVRDPILWLYDPRHVDLVGKFGEKLSCYFVYDEYAEFVGNQRIKEVAQRYDRLMSARASVILASSRAQWERRKPLNPNTHFVPNAVDFAMFNRALDPALPVPAELADRPRPVIGYAGWLGYQTDVELLLRIAEAYPSGSLVLVGPDVLPRDAAYERLRAMPNVHFLGRKEMRELPAYLKGFDVALLPYLLDGHVRMAYPLKLHEYLAAGRAIVSAALPEVLPFGHLLRITESHDEFVRAIGAAAGDYSAEAVRARVAVARANSWDQRILQIHQILEPLLAGGPRETTATAESPGLAPGLRGGT